MKRMSLIASLVAAGGLLAPAAARVERPRRARWQQHQQKCQQCDEVVVVQVGALVEQLGVSEQQAEYERTPARVVAKRQSRGSERHRTEVQIQAPQRPRPHPIEAEVSEVKRGFGVEFADPAE